MHENIDTFLADIAQAHPNRDHIKFICIGSDRSTGDSFGPIIGTMLKEQGWKHVIGTLEKPCDAYAVEAAARSAQEYAADDDAIVIAIDACLGQPRSVGCFIVARGPLQPGEAVGKRLPPIGDYSIAGVVNSSGPKAYAMLQTTSLHHVVLMAKHVAQAIQEAWCTKTKKRTEGGIA